MHSVIELLNFCFKDSTSGFVTILVLVIVLGGLREIFQAIFRRK